MTVNNDGYPRTKNYGTDIFDSILELRNQLIVWGIMFDRDYIDLSIVLSFLFNFLGFPSAYSCLFLG